jgi:hypothetical protein
MFLLILMEVKYKKEQIIVMALKFLFTYEPEKPIIDAFTKLYFSVQDLEGNHIRDIKASVIVTNGQRLFKFQNITATAGDLRFLCRIYFS